MVLPLIFYALILTMVWGKIAYKIRKRLWHGALLKFLFSYMALGYCSGGGQKRRIGTARKFSHFVDEPGEMIRDRTIVTTIQRSKTNEYH